jgi:hypothetical protein
VREFLREGSIPIYGSGTPRELGSKWAVEDYPFQGLDIATDPSPPGPEDWRARARFAADVARILEVPMPDTRTSAYVKYEHYARTPFGTHQATIARGGEQYEDMLAAPCGYCSNKIASCKCGRENA